MDPSSPFAMARLVALRDQFDIALGNDADADRHGVVTPGGGLLNPTTSWRRRSPTCSAAARDWGADVGVGKTLVSSSMIDRVVADLGRRLVEVPVGFKWFVDGLVDGSIGFGGEESAGASFLRRDGTVWTTDKDGIIADLLACELTARTGPRPGRRLRRARPSGSARPAYRRIDAPATPELRRPRSGGCAGDVTATTLAGDPITAILTRAPGNDAPIGGLKVVDRAGLVRRPPVGDGERHQALRGVLPRRGPPRAHPRGGAGDPRRGGLTRAEPPGTGQPRPSRVRATPDRRLWSAQ